MSRRAERVIEEWTELENRSDELFHAMTKSVRTAYFELVHSAIMLMANLNRLYVAGEFINRGVSVLVAQCLMLFSR